MKKIILVEDDDSIRDVFEMILGKRYELIVLADGDSIVSASLDRPDLFILDKNISGTNGLDLCRFIKNSHFYGQVPVVMLSASPDIEAMALEAGADDSIEKPFTLQKLRNTIENALEPREWHRD